MASGRLGDSEIHNLRRRSCHHKDVRWLDVSMDDSFLVRMLYRVADLGEEVQTSVDREGMSVAIIGDLDAINQFHHEIRPPTFRCARIEYARNIRMIHQSKRLPLGFKACNYAFGVHSWFNDLECDAAADRLLLLSYENEAACSFSDLLHQLA